MRHAAALLLALAALAALLPAAGSAQQAGPCVAEHVLSKQGYRSRVCGVPDYDQRRRTELLGGSEGAALVAGLEGGGRCHCVPTSITALLGFYAQKGVDVAPGAFPWDARGFMPKPYVGDPPGTWLDKGHYPLAEVAAYNRVGAVIKALGGSVDSDFGGPCGTSYEEVFDDLEQLHDAGAFPRARFTWGVFGVEAGTPRAIASNHAIGGLASIAYGRYSGYEEDDKGRATAKERTGGHAVAVEGIRGDSVQARLLYRDPDDGELADHWRQSAFALEEQALSRITLTVDGTTRKRWRFGSRTGAMQRVADTWIALRPTYLVTTSGKDLGFMPGLQLNRQGTGYTTVPVEGEVTDAAFVASTGEIAYITKGSGKLRALGIADRTRRTIATVPRDTTDLESDPAGAAVFALSGDEIRKITPSGEVVDRVDLGRPADALAYDTSPRSPAAERLVAVSISGRRATTIDPRGLRLTARQVLPRGAVGGRGRLRATIGATGALQLRRGASAARAIGGRAPAVPAGDDGGLVATDAGTTLTVRDGRTVEVAADGRVLPDSPFAGVPLRGRVLAVSRSGGDLLGPPPRTVLDARTAFDPAFPEMALDRPAAQDRPGPPPPEPQPQDRRPDLRIDAVDRTGVTIRNAGLTDAGPFDVRLTRGTSEPDRFEVPGLAAGATRRVSFNDCLRLQERTVTVDVDGAVDESDETNNAATFRCPGS